ncbi:hypothetical protein GCM10009555_096720 [Acrocarpospora macrocephala]|uniref:Uncharacterized protein n=1 Tax=Acrocarpospora macrocephala TaxID=150177 RepID=A0A5M3WRL0_9ACTN|nr:hypothetical protein Amac_029790 [Acrocarpospora macrocephala]
MALLEGRIDLPPIGEVRAGDRPSMPYLVVDANGTEVDPISKYLRDLVLGDASPLTCRSYAQSRVDHTGLGLRQPQPQRGEHIGDLFPQCVRVSFGTTHHDREESRPGESH